MLSSEQYEILVKNPPKYGAVLHCYSGSTEMMEKFVSFHRRANDIKLEFNSNSYSAYLDMIKEGDFVYCDPPYLLTCGAYNDGKRGFNGWDLNNTSRIWFLIYVFCIWKLFLYSCFIVVRKLVKSVTRMFAYV